MTAGHLLGRGLGALYDLMFPSAQAAPSSFDSLTAIEVQFVDESGAVVVDPGESEVDLSGMPLDEQRALGGVVAQALEQGLEAATVRPKAFVTVTLTKLEPEDIPRRTARRLRLVAGETAFAISYDVSLVVEGGTFVSYYLRDPNTPMFGKPVPLAIPDKVTPAEMTTPRADEAAHRDAYKGFPTLIRQALERRAMVQAPGLSPAGNQSATLRGDVPSFVVVPAGGDEAFLKEDLRTKAEEFVNELTLALSLLRAHGPTYGNPEGHNLTSPDWRTWTSTQNPYYQSNGQVTLRQTPAFSAPDLPMGYRWVD